MNTDNKTPNGPDSVHNKADPNRYAIIACMGETGTGKSSFINLAVGKETVKVGHGQESCTDNVYPAELVIDGQSVILLDTPGFNDTNKPQGEVLDIIASHLAVWYRKKIKLHGVLYFHNISQKRVTGIAKQNFQIFRELCGESNLRNVVITTTMWDAVELSQGDKIVEDLTTMDQYFKPAIEKGAIMKHLNPRDVSSAHAIIRGVLKNHPSVLNIQEEIVEKKLNLNETRAGQAIDKELTELRAKYDTEMKEMKEKIKNMTTADEQAKAELKQVKEEHKMILGKLAEQQEALQRQANEHEQARTIQQYLDVLKIAMMFAM